MRISNVGLDLIKSFEGCRLKAYRCPAGVVTIGFGETGKFALTGEKIVMGMSITEEQAKDSFRVALRPYENAVNRLGVEFNQNQFDALVSFCYNLGTGIFKGSLENAIRNRNWSNVASQMLLYNKARVNGKLTVLKGLERRRQAESALFLKPVQEDTELIKAVDLLYKRGIINSPRAWYSVDRFKMEYVPGLIKHMGGINRLIKERIITDSLLWERKQYNANHVRSLIIKYSKLG